MKKISLFYYSHHGNTRFLANHIADALGTVPKELSLKEEIPVKEFVRFLRETSLEEKKQRLILEDSPRIDESWDLIIVGSPVWAHTAAPEILGLLLNYLPRKIPIAVFYSHGGKPEGFLKEIRAMVPDNPVISHCGFQSPLMSTDVAGKRVREWIQECVAGYLYEK